MSTTVLLQLLLLLWNSEQKLIWKQIWKNSSVCMKAFNWPQKVKPSKNLPMKWHGTFFFRKSSSKQKCFLFRFVVFVPISVGSFFVFCFQVAIVFWKFWSYWLRHVRFNLAACTKITTTVLLPVLLLVWTSEQKIIWKQGRKYPFICIKLFIGPQQVKLLKTCRRDDTLLDFLNFFGYLNMYFF